jgi:hypothetical protein
MPPLGPEWDTHPIDGQDLPVNPDLRGPHSLPPRVRFREPNDTQQQNELAAPADPPPIIILPPAAPNPVPQCAPTLTVDTDTDFPVDSPHPPSAPRNRPRLFDDDDDEVKQDYIIEVIEEPPPPPTLCPPCHSVSSIQYQSYTPGYTTASLSETHKINRAPTKNYDSVTPQRRPFRLQL